MGALKIKPGVQFATIAPAGARILEVLRVIARTSPHDLTITSGTDGTHSGPGDPHHSGEAYDVRVKDLTPWQVQVLVGRLTASLGPRFYVLHESPDTPNAHIHIQRRRATTYSAADYFAEPVPGIPLQ